MTTEQKHPEFSAPPPEPSARAVIAAIDSFKESVDADREQRRKSDRKRDITTAILLVLLACCIGLLLQGNSQRDEIKRVATQINECVSDTPEGGPRHECSERGKENTGKAITAIVDQLRDHIDLRTTGTTAPRPASGIEEGS